MFDISKLIDVVKTTAAIIVPGSAAAIAAGEALISLIRDVRSTLTSTDQAALDAALPELLTKMNRDVDQAISDLGGTGR